MKNHRRTPLHKELETALRHLNDRKQPGLRGRSSEQLRPKIMPSPLTNPTADTNTRTWRICGVPAIVVQEDGTVLHRPVMTLAVDNYSRIILGSLVS